ncbi:MAG: adenylate/guanylate cyclase domain-containing protein, partial [Methyloceanibacter sp.]
MRYRTRLVLLVSALLAAATIATTALLAWNTRQAILASAEQSGGMVANLLARSAALASEIPEEVEEMLGGQMVAEATILAHFVDAAEQAGLTSEEINRRLRQIADRTVLDEFWVTDDKGHAYLRNIDVDFTFSPSAEEQPQAHVFWPLLTGEKSVVVQEARQREIDDQHFKYAAVSGVDKPRIVQVGFDAKFLTDLAARVGLTRAVHALLAGGDIDAIWVFDTNLSQLAGPEIIAPESSSAPSEEEMNAIRETLKDDQTRSVLQAKALSVIAPIVGDRQAVIGAALVRIPTAIMRSTIADQLRIAAAIAAAVLATGIIISIISANHQIAPLERITAAAEAVEDRKFDPRTLEHDATRGDELGRLARVVTSMGQEVLAREERLDSLVKERTQALAVRTEQLESLSVKLSKYLSPQIYASIFQGRQQVEIASKRKKLTVFFSDLSGFTETSEDLESEELTGILNRYLNEMARIALKHGATIDKFVGDGVVAFFGDPESRGVAQDAKACVTMAVEMQRRIAELVREWEDEGLERPFSARMGINTGFCTVGNFGSQDRMDYTIIGAAVNLAARLEQAAGSGKILISHETWALVKDVVVAEERPPIKVKGIAQPIHAYEVKDLREALPSEIIRLEEDGLKVTIDLGRSDRKAAREALEKLLGEIDKGDA